METYGIKREMLEHDHLDAYSIPCEGVGPAEKIPAKDFINMYWGFIDRMNEDDCTEIFFEQEQGYDGEVSWKIVGYKQESDESFLRRVEGAKIRHEMEENAKEREERELYLKLKAKFDTPEQAEVDGRVELVKSIE